MGAKYKGQKLTIELDTKQDLTIYYSVAIRCKKPNNTITDIPATVMPDKKSITATIDLDTVNEWIVWAVVFFTETNRFAGEPVKFFVLPEGTK